MMNERRSFRANSRVLSVPDPRIGSSVDSADSQERSPSRSCFAASTVTPRSAATVACCVSRLDESIREASRSRARSAVRKILSVEAEPLDPHIWLPPYRAASARRPSPRCRVYNCPILIEGPRFLDSSTQARISVTRSPPSARHPDREPRIFSSPLCESVR